jgi:hypothetical protein
MRRAKLLVLRAILSEPNSAFTIPIGVGRLHTVKCRDFAFVIGMYRVHAGILPGTGLVAKNPALLGNWLFGAAQGPAAVMAAIPLSTTLTP